MTPKPSAVEVAEKIIEAFGGSNEFAKAYVACLTSLPAGSKERQRMLENVLDFLRDTNK